MPTRSFASRFESGSSMRNTRGRRTIARPIATRWRCPPESCAGLRSSRSVRPSMRGDVLDPLPDLGLRGAPDLEPVAEVLADVHVRVERVALEHHRDVSVPRRDVGDVAAVDRDRAVRDLLEPGKRPEQRGLPAAGRADERDELPVLDAEGHVVERDDVALEDLGHVVELDHAHDARLYRYHISTSIGIDHLPVPCIDSVPMAPSLDETGSTSSPRKPGARRGPTTTSARRDELVELMNAADETVPAAVAAATSQIVAVIETIAESLGGGGRLIYVGAGSSGRIAALDAAECESTFSTSPGQVVALLAGGLDASLPRAGGSRGRPRGGTRGPRRARSPPGGRRRRRQRKRPHAVRARSPRGRCERGSGDGMRRLRDGLGARGARRASRSSSSSAPSSSPAPRGSRPGPPRSSSSTCSRRSR